MKIAVHAVGRMKAGPERELADRYLDRFARALVILDERGRNLSSEALASWIGERRDQGQREMLFAIGGPDGHAEDAARKAALVLSFGSLTWPHQLARVMLAEQLYRAVTILSGHPYHRA